jgi:hypothetical protein
LAFTLGIPDQWLLRVVDRVPVKVQSRKAVVAVVMDYPLQLDVGRNEDAAVAPHERMPDQVAHRMVEDKLCSYRGVAAGAVGESLLASELGLCAMTSRSWAVTVVGRRWIVFALSGGVTAAPDPGDAVVLCAAEADVGTARAVRAAAAKTMLEAAGNVRIDPSSCHTDDPVGLRLFPTARRP